jgi:hypothetical protein
MEGALLAAVVLGLDAVASWRRLHSWRWVTAYVAFVVLLTAYRLAYYGLPLPNVFYAKVGGVPVMAGIGYLVGFLYDGAVWLVPAAVVGAATDRRLRSAGAFVAIYTAYVVWIGGDAFDQWRFFVPIVPALAVFAVRGVETASSRSPYASMLLTVTIPIAVVWLVLGRPPAPIGLLCVALAVAWARALGARNLGRPAALAAVLVLGLSLLPADPGVSLASTKRARAFAQVFGSNAFGEMIGRESAEKYLGQKPIPRLIASGGVGRLAYYTQIPILDVLGLVDPVVARSVGTHADDRWVIPGHTRSDAGYVLSRSPDYIAIPREGTFYRIPAIVDLWAHPDFQARYVWDDYMGSYRRKDVESRRTDAAPPPARP